MVHCSKNYTILILTIKKVLYSFHIFIESIKDPFSSKPQSPFPTFIYECSKHPEAMYEIRTLNKKKRIHVQNKEIIENGKK